MVSNTSGLGILMVSLLIVGFDVRSGKESQSGVPSFRFPKVQSSRSGIFMLRDSEVIWGVASQPSISWYLIFSSENFPKMGDASTFTLTEGFQTQSERMGSVIALIVANINYVEPNQKIIAVTGSGGGKSSAAPLVEEPKDDSDGGQPKKPKVLTASSGARSVSSVGQAAPMSPYIPPYKPREEVRNFKDLQVERSYFGFAGVARYMQAQGSFNFRGVHPVGSEFRAYEQRSQRMMVPVAPLNLAMQVDALQQVYQQGQLGHEGSSREPMVHSTSNWIAGGSRGRGKKRAHKQQGGEACGKRSKGGDDQRAGDNAVKEQGPGESSLGVCMLEKKRKLVKWGGRPRFCVDSACL